MKPMRVGLLSFFALGFLFFSCSGDEIGGEIPPLTKVLVISNEDYDNQWILNTFPEYVDSMEFSSWDFSDSIPTLAQLNQYDVVLLFENGTEGAICDSLGDRMYTYIINGGNVVLGTFYWQDRSDGGYGEVGWGDLETIDPIIANDGDAYEYDSTGTWINHPLTRGLDTIYCYYGGGYNTLRAGATAVAWWKNGDILMAYNKPGGRIVALTLWPAEPQGENGYYKGFFRAWENALFYSAWGTTRSGESTGVPALTKNFGNFSKRNAQKIPTHHGGSRR